MRNDLLPLSKSWAIRMLFLDMVYGENTGYLVIGHFRKQHRIHLSDDILAALNCAERYIKGDDVFDVNNSGTVCRFLMYVMHGKKYELHMGDQLRGRIKNVPDQLTDLSVAELLRLGTSQYASAALLLGAAPIEHLHPKCELTVEARKTYFESVGKWVPRYDDVIIGQLNHFLRNEAINDPIAEDYCYLRAFGLIPREEGERRWPELSNHECDRLKVMEDACQNFDRHLDLPDDHRVVMAVALRQKSLGLPVRASNRKCVAKSWPQFWEWLEADA